MSPERLQRFQKITFAINRRASLFFSIGLRLLYSFFPLFLYVLGPLALLVTTVVEVRALTRRRRRRRRRRIFFLSVL